MTGRYPSVIDGDPPVTASGGHACERSVHWDGTQPHCGEPAAVITRAMCVHEHYGEGYTCWACLSDMRKQCDDGDWKCEVCAQGPEPHDCPMPMTVKILEASS
jgi:hypothetical protein